MKTPSLRLLAAPVLTGLLLAFTACSSPPPLAVAPPRVAPAPQKLLPGDTVRLNFPSSPQLDTTQVIRRDGHLNLPLLGEVVAADRTPAQLERQLREAYGDQLRSGEVSVTVVSSAFNVFVTGAVVRPGRLTPDRPLTVLTAVMQAGGFDPARANLHRVVLFRTHGGRTERTEIDLQAALRAGESSPLYLESEDIVYVPERFIWF